MVGFANKAAAEQPQLDGQIVPQINSDLTSGHDLTKQQRLKPRLGLCFMGTHQGWRFDIEFAVVRELLNAPNPDGRPNSDVLRPFRNGSDLVRVCSDRWVIDFGTDRPISDAALYESPFQYLNEHVKPFREKNNRKTRAEHWWLLGETIPAFRKAVSCHHRYLGTARVAKHRVFVWLDTVVLPDSKVIAIALPDDMSLGVLQSHVHEAWTLASCGWHGLGQRRNVQSNALL